jgi:hypothetical protein
MATAQEVPRPIVTADPVVLQRALVYAVMGFICFTGLVLTTAFKDPCASSATMQAGIAKCNATLSQRLPGPAPVIALVASFLSMMLMYELRWYIRTWLIAAIGAAEIITGILIINAGMSKVLSLANGLLGLSLLGAAYGIHLGRRGAWSYAVSACGTLAVAFFFGSAKVHNATGVHLAWAALPALAVFLPACVALGTSPPGGPRYEPFAKTASSARRTAR